MGITVTFTNSMFHPIHFTGLQNMTFIGLHMKLFLHVFPHLVQNGQNICWRLRQLTVNSVCLLSSYYSLIFSVH